MAKQQNYNCPQCGQIDRVEKVSALVGAGTSAGIYTGNTSGSGVIAGISQTALSQKLSPPAEPVYKTPWGGCSISIVIISLVLGITTCIEYSGPLTRDTLNNNSGVIITGVIIIIMVLLIFLLPGALVLWRKLVVSSARRAFVATEHPRWQHAIINWNELYYCARNDVVFRPGKPQDCVPVSQMSKLLYKP